MAREEDRLEAEIAATAARISGVQPSGPEASLGLDSLGQAELALALEDRFGVRLSDGAVLGSVRRAAQAVALGLGRRGPGRSLLEGTGPLQDAAKLLGGTPLAWYYRIRTTGADRVPGTGGVVLASNHESMWDIPILVIASPRPVVFMAKEELYRHPFGSWFFTRLGGFRVRRGAGDLTAVRTAVEVVRTGRVLAMYPEGTRRVGTLLPFLPGAAWVAIREGVPLVPVGMRGTGESMPKGSRYPRRVPVRVAFGEPMDVGREDDPRARMEKAVKLSGELRSEVERLLA